MRPCYHAPGLSDAAPHDRKTDGPPHAAMSAPTVWSHGVADLIAYAAKRGASASALHRQLGLKPSQLADPDQRIRLTTYYDVVEYVAEVLGTPYLGLEYIDEVEPASIDAVGFLAMASRTVGEAVQRIIRHHPLMNEGEIFALQIDGDVATFRYEPHGPPRPAHAFIAQMYAADCLRLPQRVAGTPVEVHRLSFARRMPGDPVVYEARLGRLPEMEAEIDSWSVSASLLNAPLPRPDPGLSRFLEKRLAQAARRSTSGPFRERVRARIAEGLMDARVSVQAIAEDLGMSARTLQRRLDAEHASFATLLRETRRERAAAYLEMGLPLGEVSYLLGYSEPSAFHRAFKEWTGIPPGRWRESKRDENTEL